MKGTKITTDNYFDTIEEVGFENLPLILKQSHMVIMTKTDMGNDWSKYKSDADLKRMINLAFRKLEELINSENDYPDNSQIKKFKTEYDLIKRFLELHNATKTHAELKSFLNKLIESIEQKKIRKTSPVANEIMFIQNALIAKSKGMASSKIKLALKDSTIQTMEDALQLISEQNIPKETKTPKKKPDNKNLNGLTETEPKTETSVNLMKSTDFANLQFNTIGFKDKWLSFIGDPAPGFTAMVFGMPKMGKSYLCVDFAGYLARNHGRVLYVAKEEKLDKTLQDKLNDKNVAHDNLDIADALPKDLNGYDFIFLDSVNKLGLSPQDLEKLKAENKGRSFIYIFQATKNGKFKGNNEFQHDVDVVIEVPEQGKAVQFGRFNQGGEMDIFSSEELSGVKQSVIEIEAELPIALEEMFIYIKRTGEKLEDITSILDDQPERGVAEIKEIVNEIIKKKKANVQLLDVEHSYNDSYNVTHGVAYFTVKLSGTKADLRKIAGENKSIVYDWDGGLNGRLKRNSLRVPKDVSMLAGNKKEPMENGKLGKELKVKIEHHSWGDIIVLKHGIDWHAILHPDDIKAIAKLRIWEKTKVKDEQGYTWEITNNGEGFNLNNLYSNYKGHFKIDREYLNAQEKGKAMKKAAPVKEKKYPAWTSSEDLNERDKEILRHIYDLYSEGKMDQAMDYASNVGDTVIREAIPSDIWVALGGKLTKTGEDSLKITKLKDEALSKIERISEVTDLLSKDKDANWGNAGSLANLHETLGTYLEDGYKEHEGYSKSLNESLKRHSSAIRKLLKRITMRVDRFVKYKHTPELAHLNQLLSECIDSFKNLKKKQDTTNDEFTPPKGIDYSDEFRELRIMYEDNMGRKFTDDEFNAIFETALRKNKHLYKNAIDLQNNFMGFLMAMDAATTEWES